MLGSEQVKALAAKMGVDPAQASHFLAEYLPKIVDKLTPEGKVDPTADPPTGFGQPASGALAKPRQQPKGDGANIAVWRVVISTQVYSSFTRTDSLLKTWRCETRTVRFIRVVCR